MDPEECRLYVEPSAERASYYLSHLRREFRKGESGLTLFANTAPFAIFIWLEQILVWTNPTL